MGAGKSREIKDRIKGVKSTHQITNAMNIVSSTKFKRFSALVEKSRPYAESLHGVLKNIAAGLKSEKHPLLDGKKTVVKGTGELERLLEEKDIDLIILREGEETVDVPIPT